MNQKMLASISAMPPRLVYGDPGRVTPAADGSGLLVYVQDVQTGSMIRIGKQYLFELDGFTPVE
jgi:hypothetical protein